MKDIKEVIYGKSFSDKQNRQFVTSGDKENKNREPQCESCGFFMGFKKQ